MKIIIKSILPAALFIAVGCISWDEGWKTKVQATGKGDIKMLFESALVLESNADSGDKVKNVIGAYENITAIEPDSYSALSKLAEFTYLYAYMYTIDKKEKEKYYIKSLNYSERAMYTNAKFRELADQGEPVWESVSTLSSNEMEAMFYWYVGAGQYWTECFNSFSHLLNFYWPARAKLVLNRMSAINPDWDNGRVHMSWGAFYSILPGFLGGDVKKSAEEFSKGIKVAPDALNNYYVRARYLHLKNGDREAFKKDLEHVLSADIKKINYPYPWAASYKMKAKELLDQTDKLFK